jgi:hypothetical protein
MMEARLVVSCMVVVDMVVDDVVVASMIVVPPVVASLVVVHLVVVPFRHCEIHLSSRRCSSCRSVGSYPCRCSVVHHGVVI